MRRTNSRLKSFGRVEINHRNIGLNGLQHVERGDAVGALSGDVEAAVRLAKSGDPFPDKGQLFCKQDRVSFGIWHSKGAERALTGLSSNCNSALEVISEGQDFSGKFLDCGYRTTTRGRVPSRMETATDTATGGSKWIVQLGEAANRGRFVVKDLENRVQLRDLQQIFHALGQVQELQLATLIGHARKSGNHLADARAVDIADIAKVQKQLSISVR